MSDNPRAIATKILVQVIVKHRSLTDVLSQSDLHLRQQTSLIKALCFGVCRWYFYLTTVAAPFLTKPLKTKDQDIYLLILIGLYQILYLRIPNYAAVQETVSATRDLQKPWANQLVNGVLRHYLRQCQLKGIDDASIQYAYPEWIKTKMMEDWPNDWEAILATDQHHPPLCLRINRLKTTVPRYLKTLLAANITADYVPNSPDALILHHPQTVTQLPGYEAGQFTVQDSAAQFAAHLLMLTPGLQVLDACAAPGGKTTHILEIEPSLGKLVAIDKIADRVAILQKNLQRICPQSTVTCLTADANHPDQWWDGQLFDRILLDAPCSGSGVIRRHPDIKLLRQAEDIPILRQQQCTLLESVWQLLKPGGLLLYVTCSLFHAENSSLILDFLRNHPEAMEAEINESWGIKTYVGRQLLMGYDNRDGFYYARLVKRTIC